MCLPPSPIGFDTSVLINFCAIGRLGLLVRCVPPPRYLVVDVRDELRDVNSRRLVDRMIKRCELLLITATERSAGAATARWYHSMPGNGPPWPRRQRGAGLLPSTRNRVARRRRGTLGPGASPAPLASCGPRWTRG